MARFNSTLNLWVASDGTHWPSEEAARAHESESQTTDAEFAASYGQPSNVRGAYDAEVPQAPLGGKVGRAPRGGRPELPGAPMSDAEYARRQNLIDVSDAATATRNFGYNDTRRKSQADWQAVEDQYQADQREKDEADGTDFAATIVPNLGAIALGTVNPFLGFAGAAANDQALYSPTNKANATYYDNSRKWAAENAANASTGSGAPGTDTDALLEQAGEDTAEAESEYDAIDAENRAENAANWADARKRYDNIGSDNTLGDEARGWQREGLAQQRQLLERLLGFDENAYATRYGDEALARSIALGRSSGTGYGSQQAGVLAAMDQAPALYAEGARQAATLANQRLAAAGSAATSFGNLATMTRGNDEARAQFDANLELSIANGVSELTNNQVQLNEAESQRFADIWLKFAQLQSVYAGMSSAEQIAWWKREMEEAGLANQWKIVEAQLKAKAKGDLIGGLFQLGGGVIGAGGQMGSAYINSNAKSNSTASNATSGAASTAGSAASSGTTAYGTPAFSGNYGPGLASS